MPMLCRIDAYEIHSIFSSGEVIGVDILCVAVEARRKEKDGPNYIITG